MTTLNPIAYWKQRHQTGTSGAGVPCSQARFKVDFINAFTHENNVRDLLDLGCGEGSIMQQLQIPRYVGVDISEAALAHCRALVLNDTSREFYLRSELNPNRRATLSLSMDVIEYLTDDAAFADYMETLFGLATRFVIVYANPNAPTPHRRFTGHVQRHFADWRLAAHYPNPYKPELPDESLADFFIFNRPGEPCGVLSSTHRPLPAAVF
jgi:SAM-dependent methyltransferase